MVVILTRLEAASARLTDGFTRRSTDAPARVLDVVLTQYQFGFGRQFRRLSTSSRRFRRFDRRRRGTGCFGRFLAGRRCHDGRRVLAFDRVYFWRLALLFGGGGGRLLFFTSFRQNERTLAQDQLVGHFESLTERQNDLGGQVLQMTKPNHIPRYVTR